MHQSFGGLSLVRTFVHALFSLDSDSDVGFVGSRRFMIHLTSIGTHKIDNGWKIHFNVPSLSFALQVLTVL